MIASEEKSFFGDTFHSRIPRDAYIPPPLGFLFCLCVLPSDRLFFLVVFFRVETYFLYYAK